MKSLYDLWQRHCHPAGAPVDIHHAVWCDIMTLVRVDRSGVRGEHFTYVEPMVSEYRNGAIVISPGMWAWLCAVHVAEFYKPEAVRWGE